MIGLVLASLLLRGLSGEIPGVTAAPRQPAAARRGWAPRTLTGVAVPQLATAVLIGSGRRSGLAAGYLAGLLLVAWIVVEMLILRRYFFLQPVIAAVGAAKVLLAWRW